jgi:peptidoglycan hydrolase CwlO-like protein
MKTKCVFLVLVFVVMWPTGAFAQDYFYSNQMTDKEYQEELKRWDKKKQNSLSRITQLQNDITSLNEDISKLSENIARVRRETLQILNSVADNSFNIKRGQITLSVTDRERTKMD